MAKNKGEVKLYKAKTPIKHDGEDYGPGEDIELNDTEAKMMLDVGAIEPAPAKAPAEGPKGKPEDKPKGKPAGNPGDGKTPPAGTDGAKPEDAPKA